MITQIGTEELKQFQCDACDRVFLAKECPARCPNAKCRRTALGKPVGRPSAADLDRIAEELRAKDLTMHVQSSL